MGPCSKDLGKVDFSAPGWPWVCHHAAWALLPIPTASLASDRSGVSGVHQWSVMLPTSARVAQEVYEPLIGIPQVCVRTGHSSTTVPSVLFGDPKQSPGGRLVGQWYTESPAPAPRRSEQPSKQSAKTLASQLQLTRRPSCRPWMCHHWARSTSPRKDRACQMSITGV